jgi:hypothetical protein
VEQLKSIQAEGTMQKIAVNHAVKMVRLSLEEGLVSPTIVDDPNQPALRKAVRIRRSRPFRRLVSGLCG